MRRLLVEASICEAGFCELSLFRRVIHRVVVGEVRLIVLIVWKAGFELVFFREAGFEIFRFFGRRRDRLRWCEFLVVIIFVVGQIAGLAAMKVDAEKILSEGLPRVFLAGTFGARVRAGHARGQYRQALRFSRVTQLIHLRTGVDPEAKRAWRMRVCSSLAS